MTLPGRSPRFVDREAERVQRARELAKRLGRVTAERDALAEELARTLHRTAGGPQLLARLVAGPEGAPLEARYARPAADGGEAVQAGGATLVYAPEGTGHHSAWPNLPPYFPDYIREAAGAWHMTRPELLSARRTQIFVAARADCIWHASVAYGLSLPLIGRLMGKRDHTTVLHALRRATAALEAAFALDGPGLMGLPLIDRRRALASAWGQRFPGDEGVRP